MIEEKIILRNKESNKEKKVLTLKGEHDDMTAIITVECVPS